MRLEFFGHQIPDPSRFDDESEYFSTFMLEQMLASMRANKVAE